MTPPLFFLPLLTLLLLASPSTQATVLVQMDLPQLVGRADAIFVGTVTKTESRWSEDGRHIITETTLRVEQDLKNTKAGSEVTVRSLGGTVNGIGMKVVGSPSFSPRQRVLLFTDLRRGHRYVTGMTQGLFRIHQDSAGKLQVRPQQGEALLTRRTDKGLEPVAPLASAARPLSSFVKDIRATIQLCAKETNRCRIP